MIWNKAWRPSVSFSGTREGMTNLQWHTLNHVLHSLNPSEFHHGDCIGADAKAHELVRMVYAGAELHVHPGNFDPSIVHHKYRAYTKGHFNYPSEPFLYRNQTMVKVTDITICAPKESQPVLRSGTWSTFRYSLSNLKPTILIQPDGTAVFYDSGKIIMKTATFTLGTLNADSAGTTGMAIHESPNGYLGFYVASTGGTFGTLKVQASPSDTGTTDYADVPSGSWTAAGYKHLQVFGRRLRLVLTGSTTPGISVVVAGVSSGVTVTSS